jgi:hypothetical protein
MTSDDKLAQIQDMAREMGAVCVVWTRGDCERVLRQGGHDGGMGEELLKEVGQYLYDVTRHFGDMTLKDYVRYFLKERMNE